MMESSKWSAGCMTADALAAETARTLPTKVLTGTMVSSYGAVPPACADATGKYTVLHGPTALRSHDSPDHEMLNVSHCDALP